nr:isoform 2 of sugar transporter erd6-like 5 [Quercus suber]
MKDEELAKSLLVTQQPSNIRVSIDSGSNDTGASASARASGVTAVLLLSAFVTSCSAFAGGFVILVMAPKKSRNIKTKAKRVFEPTSEPIEAMIPVSVSVAYLIGSVINWRALALIGAIPCLLLLFGLFFIPESPRWLAKIGREREFEAALQRLRGKNVNISEEAADIKDYTENIQKIPEDKILDLFQQKYSHLLIVGIGLMVLQQCGELNGYAYYMNEIFELAGVPSITGFIVVSIPQVSVTGECLGCFLTGLSFVLQNLNWWMEATPTLMLSGMVILVMAPKKSRNIKTKAKRVFEPTSEPIEAMIPVSVSVAYLIGSVINWRALALIGAIPCLLLLFGLFFIPESPRWLAKIGREREFEAALQRLRGKNVNISEEAADIKDYTENIQKIPEDKILDLFQQKYSHLLIVGIGLMVLQQCGELNGYAYYMNEIFELAGVPSITGFIVVSIPQVSVTGECLGCFLTGLSFVLQNLNWWMEATPTLMLSGMVEHFSYKEACRVWVFCSLQSWYLRLKGEL